MAQKKNMQRSRKSLTNVKRHARTAKKTRNRRLLLEQMEPRRLLASVNVYLTGNGTLRVEGDSDPNLVQIAQSRNELTVAVKDGSIRAWNGVAMASENVATIDNALVTSIESLLQGGDDTFQALVDDVAVTLYSGPGNDHSFVEAPRVYVDTGPGDDVAIANAVDSYLVGWDGNDFLGNLYQSPKSSILLGGSGNNRGFGFSYSSELTPVGKDQASTHISNIDAIFQGIDDKEGSPNDTGSPPITTIDSPRSQSRTSPTVILSDLGVFGNTANSPELGYRDKDVWALGSPSTGISGEKLQKGTEYVVRGEGTKSTASGADFVEPPADSQDVISLSLKKGDWLEVELKSINRAEPSSPNATPPSRPIVLPGVKFSIYDGDFVNYLGDYVGKNGRRVPLYGVSSLPASKLLSEIGFLQQESLNKPLSVVDPGREVTIVVDKIGQFFQGYELRIRVVDAPDDFANSLSEIPVDVGGFRYAPSGDASSGQGSFAPDKKTFSLQVEQGESSGYSGQQLVVVIPGREETVSSALQRDILDSVKPNLSPNATILAADWSRFSNTNPFFDLQRGAEWIRPVGRAIGEKLTELGFAPDQVTIIGNSWGTHVGFFAAEAMPGKIYQSYSLDPAALFHDDSILGVFINNDNRGYNLNDINLRRVARNSLAIHTDTGEVIGAVSPQRLDSKTGARQAVFGEHRIAETAHNTIRVFLSEDSTPVDSNLNFVDARLRMHEAPARVFIEAQQSNSAALAGLGIGERRTWREAGSGSPDATLLAKFQFDVNTSETAVNSGVIVEPIVRWEKRAGETGQVAVEADGSITHDHRATIHGRKNLTINGKAKKVSGNYRKDLRKSPSLPATGFSTEEFLTADDKNDIFAFAADAGSVSVNFRHLNLNGAESIDGPSKLEAIVYLKNGKVHDGGRFPIQNGSANIELDVPDEGGYVVVRLKNSEKRESPKKKGQRLNQIVATKYAVQIRQSADRDALRRRLDIAKEKVATAEAELVTASNKLTHLEDELSNTKASRDSKHSAMLALIQTNKVVSDLRDAAQRELQVATSSLGNATNRLEELKSAKLQAEASARNLTTQIDTAVKQRRQLKNQADKALQVKQNRWRRYKNAKGQAKKAALYNKWQEARDAHRNVESAWNAAKNKVTSLESQRKNARKTADNVSKEIPKQRKVIDRAKKDHRSAQAVALSWDLNYEASRQQIDQVKNRLTVLDQEIEKLQTEVKSALGNKNEKEDALRLAREELAEAQSRFSKSE